MLRGQFCWVNLSDAKPPELGKVRPAIVISNAEQNQILQSVVIVPLSTHAGEIWPLRVSLQTTVSPKESFAVIPGLRQVSKTRLVKQGGLLPAHLLGRLTKAVNEYLTD